MVTNQLSDSFTTLPEQLARAAKDRPGVRIKRPDLRSRTVTVDFLAIFSARLAQDNRILA